MVKVPDRPTDRPPEPPMGRIVQVRGASGSGKSTLVRNLMAELTDRYGPPNRWYVPGRKNPIALTFQKPVDPTGSDTLTFSKPVRPLCVVGHYGSVSTGGVDTITEKETPYRVAREAVRQGFDVLLEGIFISIEYWRTLYLHQDGFDRYDVWLDLTVEECTEWVHRRQEAAGRERTPLKQMADYHPRMMYTRSRLITAGVPVETLLAFSSHSVPIDDFVARTTRVREMALVRVKELLHVP